MKTIRKNARRCTHAAVAIATAAMLTIPAANAGLARGHLYSTAAVNDFCRAAATILTSSNVEVKNTIYSDWDDFVQADATPYQVVPGLPEPTYSPPEAPALPLGSAQHVVYGYYGTGNRDFPKVISCKVKNAEFLVQTGIDTGAVDRSCSAVNTFYVNEVVASLANPEVAQIVMEPDTEVAIESEFDLEADDETGTGTEWTDGFPDDPFPVLYREFEGGPVHVQARTLFVPTNPFVIPFCNASPFLQSLSFCQPRKWAVRYCHVP